jgi:hypothetical protein
LKEGRKPLKELKMSEKKKYFILLVFEEEKQRTEKS